jgi:hypothetical protein
MEHRIARDATWSTALHAMQHRSVCQLYALLLLTSFGSVALTEEAVKLALVSTTVGPHR